MSELTGISQKPAILSVILILVTAILGFTVIGPLIGILTALPFYEGTLFDLPQKMANPLANPEIRMPLIILQGSATLIGLILIPYLYLFSIEKIRALNWLKEKHTSPIICIVITVIVISFMVINSVIIEWNANVVFPDFLRGFGEWARANEARATELTKFFTTFTSPADFALGVLVIAIFPAIGEELVFRGMLQPELFRMSGNHHVAIWVSAIIFSAFHLQFFGFLPRMLLGALFGYLYLWSGNFWVPVIAHFVNNAFSVLMMYLYQLGYIQEDFDSPKAAPWPAVIAFTILFGFLLRYFKKYYEPRNQPAS